MITKTITKTGSKGHHIFTLTVQEDSTSSNSSFLSFTFKISATNSSWQWRSYNNITYTITINGTNYTGTIPNFNGSTTTLKTANNIEVAHETDGTKTINISFSVTDPNTSVTYTCGNASASSTMTLTSLHTPPTIGNVTITEVNPRIGTTNKLFEHLSGKRIEIPASAYEGATISKYRVYNGNELLSERTTSQYIDANIFTIGYSNVTLQTTKISNVYYAIVGIEVEDSLGGITRTNKLLQVVSYDKPNIIATETNTQRIGQSTGRVAFNLKATYTYGYVDTIYNTISSLSFAYWSKNGTESSTYYDIDLTQAGVSISGGYITITNVELKENSSSLNIGTGAYYFKFKLTDGFNQSSIVKVLCVAGEYQMCEFDDHIDFKKPTINHYPLRVIESGYEDTITAVSGNSYVDIPITFNHTFTNNPNISLTLVSSSTAGAFGSVTITVLPSSVSTTGFTARVFNAGSSSRDIRFYWLAIEPIVSS